MEDAGDELEVFLASGLLAGAGAGAFFAGLGFFAMGDWSSSHASSNSNSSNTTVLKKEKKRGK